MIRKTQETQPRVFFKQGAGGNWLQFTDPCRILIACRMDEVLSVIQGIDEAAQQEGLHAAGFVSYEAAPAFDASLPSKENGEFPLAWFGLFRRVHEIQRLPDGSGSPCTPSWQPSITPDQYRRCLHVIREYIRNGDTYQVNFTYRLRTTADADPWELFLQIMATDPAPYSAFVDTGEWAICSASPELFFSLNGDQIESRPMKGTAARGLWKERAENVMITDMVRNDLGRIAICGTVHVPALFSVERYPTVWQMTSTVRARTQTSLDQIFTALFPPASITGAPKRRTMEIIAELETMPRSIYTGAIGFLHPNRVAQFNVAIRTVLMHRPSHRLEYGVGGGIVWDSDPANELEECSLKAKALSPSRRNFELLETILWSPHEGYSLLEYHLNRLARSAEYFAFDVDLHRIRKNLVEKATGLPPIPHQIRLVVAKDGGLRCEAAPLEPASMHFGDICLAGKPVDKSSVLLYHKTTDRRVYEDAVRQHPGNSDVLLFNEAGQITESTFANVAVDIDGVLYTPPLCCGLLPGTYRAWLLNRRQIKERVLTIEDALRSPNIYLMNSVRGMHKVRIVPSG